MSKGQRKAYTRRRQVPEDPTTEPETAPLDLVQDLAGEPHASATRGACSKASASRGAEQRESCSASAGHSARCDVPPWDAWDECARAESDLPASAYPRNADPQDDGFPSMPCQAATREHRPKLAVRTFLHNACIARSVTKAEIARETAAQKAMQVEWVRLRAKGVWGETSVREWDDVAA